MEGIEIIRNEPILQKAFKFIIENSESNYLPYHDLNHLLTVLKYADYIANGEEVYYDQRKGLWLAALFHDVDHSGGELEDEKNIENAQRVWCNFLKQEGIKDELSDEVLKLIDATQFPYVKPHSNISRLEKIIRDADMMQQFEYNWVGQSTLGLAKEAGIPIRDFISKQRIFLEDIKFLTETARQFKKDNWSRVMNEFRILEVSMEI